MFYKPTIGPRLPPGGQAPGLPAQPLENPGRQRNVISEADLLAVILEAPFAEGSDTYLAHFCRLKQIVPPRRSRAIFDVLVTAGKAKDFPAAQEVVKTYLRDYLDMPL